MTQHEGTFTIPTRIFLNEKHRVLLQHLVLREGLDLPELLSELLVHYLDSMPAPKIDPGPPRVDRQAELEQRRAELRRVRARQQSAGKDAPPWLVGYIADLEADIRRMSDER